MPKKNKVLSYGQDELAKFEIIDNIRPFLARFDLQLSQIQIPKLKNPFPTAQYPS